MNYFYRLALWNTNGSLEHRLELSTFLHSNKIDIMLISKTHATCKPYFKIRGYDIYDKKHPDGTAHGGTAIIIKKDVNRDSHIASSPISQSSFFKRVRCLILASSQLRGYIEFL